MTTILRRLSDNHPIYKSNEINDIICSMGSFVMFDDFSVDDKRKDSMFQTFSDAQIVSALTPVQTKMKPYINYANQKWTASEYDIPIDNSNWLKPKTNCSTANKHTKKEQINNSQVIIYGHHYSPYETDKNYKITKEKCVKFSPAKNSIDTNVNNYKRKKKSGRKRANTTDKSHNKTKHIKKRKNKRRKKRSRTVHMMTAETPILYYADDGNDGSLQFNKNWNEMLNESVTELVNGGVTDIYT